MNNCYKKQTFIMQGISILTIVLLIGLIMFKIAENNSTDNLKFKEEYESLNDVYDKDLDITYPKIKINKNNPIKYVEDSNLIDILKNGTNVIYFGWNTCPWCRNAIPVLFDAAKEANIDTIYYYNIKRIRTAYETNPESADGKLYKEVIDILGQYVESTFENSDEKRLTVPDVYYIQDGSVIGHHANTVESHTKGTDKLTAEQQKELKNIYLKIFKTKKIETCSADGC